MKKSELRLSHVLKATQYMAGAELNYSANYFVSFEGYCCEVRAGLDVYRELMFIYEG